jgi:lipopolysaccharide biosynthesis regulator YciM
MFSRVHFILFTLIFIAFGYLFYLNPGSSNFTLFQDYSLNISPALVAFGAFILGAIFVFLVTLFVDAKRAFELWRSTKHARVQGRIRERYSDALEEILRGNIHQAKEMLTRMLEKRPEHLPSYISLANLYTAEGKPTEAINILNQARALEPENLEVLFNLVKNSLALKKYAPAMETLDHILDRDPANREALRQKREIYIIQGDWNAAYRTQKEIVKKTKEKDETSGEKRILSGMEYKFAEDLAQKGSFREAEKSLREIIREDHEFLPAHVSLGDVLQRRGSSEEAAQVWMKALDISWNPIFLERLESLYLSIANPQKILNLYRKYMNQRPQDGVLRFFFGRLLIRLEMIDEAIEQLRELETAGASFSELFILMGQAYHRRGDSSQAMESYEKALEMKKFPLPAYQCSVCEKTQVDWTAFCSSCHSWGTYSIHLPEISQKFPVIPFYNFPART